jgi:uncharacterized protein
VSAPEGIRVAAITVHPLKGAAGIQVDDWPLDAFGLRWDRRWVLVDDEGVFLSQRAHPRLALVRPRLVDRDGAPATECERASGLRLELPDGGMANLALLPARGDEVRVRIWRDRVSGLAPGGEADRQLSRFLDTPVRAVVLPEDGDRPVDPGYARDARVAFADGFPVLLLSVESLEELNRRLSEPVPMDRFRPNLVVQGVGAPHAEDGWRRIRIGDVPFDVVKPCARCAVTTVDQRSGVRGKEPLRTLATYRARNLQVYFGQNLVHRKGGRLRVGAPVVVEAQGPPVVGDF